MNEVVKEKSADVKSNNKTMALLILNFCIPRVNRSRKVRDYGYIGPMFLHDENHKKGGMK